mgnify:CR=1 FL=1
MSAEPKVKVTLCQVCAFKDREELLLGIIKGVCMQCGRTGSSPELTAFWATLKERARLQYGRRDGQFRS